MTSPVTKCNLVLTWQNTCVSEEPPWLWIVFKVCWATMAVDCIQNMLTVCQEKLHQAWPEKVPVCLKLRGCNTWWWNEQSRTWSLLWTPMCVGSSLLLTWGFWASMPSMWPMLTRGVTWPRDALVGQCEGTFILHECQCSWARSCFSVFSLKTMSRGLGGQGWSCFPKRQEGKISFPHLCWKNQICTN